MQRTVCGVFSTQREGEEMANFEDEELLSRWFRTFRFFEYRKKMRYHSGSGREGWSGGVVSFLLPILWLVSFALSNVEIDQKEQSITLQFASVGSSQQSSPTETDIFLFIGIGLSFIVLACILIVIFWRVRWQCELTCLVMVVSTVILVVVRSYINTPSLRTAEEILGLSKAYLAIQFTTAALIADIVLYYLWASYLLPSILRWEWSRVQDVRSRQLFPWWRLGMFLLFALLVLPLWLLIVGSYFVLLLLQLVGVPLVDRSAFEFLTLWRGAWTLTLLKHERVAEAGRNTTVILIQYKFATWRTFLTPLLSQGGAHFEYCGQVDEEGRPHGTGQWRDAERGGEFLQGNWANGLPVAPFTSREQSDFGGTFAATRVGFVDLTCNTAVDRKNGGCRFSAEPRFGVSSVEACVRVVDRFFADFPDASTMLPCPSEGQSFDAMWASLVPERRVKSGLGEGASIPAAQRGVEELKSEWSSSSYSSTSWMSSQEERKEENENEKDRGAAEEQLDSLIFVPGFNSTLLSALEIVGQMLLMSGLDSSRVATIVFKWPGGALPSFYDAQQLCQGYEVVESFDALVASLHAASAPSRVRRVHILAHSMGCRVLLNVLTTSRFADFGQVVFAQPELDLDAFRAAAAFCATRCENITVYVNAGDRALFGAEIFNRTFPSSGCCSRLLGQSHPSLGRASRSSLLDSEGYCVEGVDIIDTSSVHSNVTEIKHSFFHLSRETIDDVKDIVLSGLPAVKRKGRLIQRNNSGNVFDVCVAPALQR